MSNKILDVHQLRQKAKRMAYQIVENNYHESELYFIGIKREGFYLAEHLKEEASKICSIDIHLHAIQMDKKNPLSMITLDVPTVRLKDQVIILIDDVANSGRTMAYAMQTLLQIIPKKIQTAVLVDRKHKAFPIHSDYVGLSLATTLQEHISVILSEEDKVGAYLE